MTNIYSNINNADEARKNEEIIKALDKKEYEAIQLEKKLLLEANKKAEAIRLKLVQEKYALERPEIEKRYHIETRLMATEMREMSKSVDLDALREVSRLKTCIRMKLPHKKCRVGACKCSSCKVKVQDAYRSLLLTDIDAPVRAYILRLVDKV